MQNVDVTNRLGHRPPSIAIPPRVNTKNSTTVRKTNPSDEPSSRNVYSHQSCSNPFKHTNKSKANFPSFESAFQMSNIKKSSSLWLINESFEDDSFLETISHGLLDLSQDDRATWGRYDKDLISPLSTDEDIMGHEKMEQEESFLDQTVDSFFNSSRVECLITPEKSRVITRDRPETRGNTSTLSSHSCLDTSTLSSKTMDNKRLSMGSNLEDLDEEGDIIQLFNRVLHDQQSKSSSSFGVSTKSHPNPTPDSSETLEDPSFLHDGEHEPWNKATGLKQKSIDLHSPFDGTFCLEESIMIFNHESPDLVMNTTLKDQSLLEVDGWMACPDKNIDLMQDSPPSERSGFGFDMSSLIGDQDDVEHVHDVPNLLASISTNDIGSDVHSSPCLSRVESRTLYQATSYTYPSYLMKELQNKYLNSDLLKLSKDLFIQNKLGGTDEKSNIKEALRRPLSTLASKYLNSSKNQSFSVETSTEQAPSNSVRTSTSSVNHNKENQVGHQSLSTSFISNVAYKFEDPDDSLDQSGGFCVNKLLCTWRT